MSEYLSNVILLQADGAPIAEALFATLSELATNPIGAIRTMSELSDEMSTFGDQWEQLEPPPEASDLHHRQIDIVRRIVSFSTDLNDALSDNVEPGPSLIAELEELGVLSPQLNAEWSRFIGDALGSR